MSSRTRYISNIGGGWTCGKQAIYWLEKATGRPLVSKAEILAAAKALNGYHGFWIFKEPRNTKRNHSRYQIICAGLGIGHPRKRKQNGANNGPTKVGKPPGTNYNILLQYAAGLQGQQSVATSLVPEELLEL